MVMLPFQIPETMKNIALAFALIVSTVSFSQTELKDLGIVYRGPIDQETVDLVFSEVMIIIGKYDLGIDDHTQEGTTPFNIYEMVKLTETDMFVRYEFKDGKKKWTLLVFANPNEVGYTSVEDWF